MKRIKISNVMKIFITGVSSGIGKTLCEKLVTSGYEVWGVARSKNLLEGLKTELKSDNFIYSICDVSKEEEIKKVLFEMMEKDFLPDVVVLNAAIEKKDLADRYQNKITKEVFSINFFGALEWVDLFIKKFLERGSGQFIAVSSLFAKRPDIDSVPYCASKSALSMAFRSLYLKYRQKNIFFTNIYFGPVNTNISFSYKSNNSKNIFTISPENAALDIIKAIKGKKPNYFFPFWIALFVRGTSSLSDLVFYKFTKIFRR